MGEKFNRDTTVEVSYHHVHSLRRIDKSPKGVGGKDGDDDEVLKHGSTGVYDKAYQVDEDGDIEVGQIRLRTCPWLRWDEGGLPLYPRGLSHFKVNKNSGIRCGMRKMMVSVIKGEFLFRTVGGTKLGPVVGGDWSHDDDIDLVPCSSVYGDFRTAFQVFSKAKYGTEISDYWGNGLYYVAGHALKVRVGVGVRDSFTLQGIHDLR